MPGITGIISRKPAEECVRVVTAMTASLQYEPSYVSGRFQVPEFGLFCGWTAHEHSFASGQVFQNESGDVALIFAGECHIDAAVRAGLKQRGHQFSGSGGHYLVHQYEELGDDFFKNLNGLFSGLLVDKRRGKMFLFNDRYALERIYWHENKDGFYFASEAKALLRVLPQLRELDDTGTAEFLSVGGTLGTRTLFRGMERLPGASLWTWENGGWQRNTYFSPATWEALPKLSESVYETTLRDTFQKITPKYFENDSKIGIALTGGLDTRMILACRPAGKNNLVSYTFTGPSGRTLDDRVAARVAAACGMEHHLLRLNPDFFSNFGAHVDQTVFTTDGYYGVFGAHEIYCHQQAKPLATVRMTGNYGGEIYRVISTFKPMRLAPALFEPGVAASIGEAAERLKQEKQNPTTFSVFKELPWSLFGNLSAGRSQMSFRTPYLDNELVALAYQCPPEAKKSSLPTLRLIKACDPVLDRIPTDRGFIGDRRGPGILLRRAFAEVTFKLDYYSIAGVPRRVAMLNPFYQPVVNALGIAGMHKFLRYSVWFRKELAQCVRERCRAAAQSQIGRFWAEGFPETMAQEHINGRYDYSPEINMVMTLEAIERRLLRGWPKD